MKISTALATMLYLTMTLCAPLSAAPRTEVIPLDYSMAESMIPVIQPLLHADERVSAYGNQLIIRAEPERLQEIRAMLTELDRQPARLRISVSNTGDTINSENGHRVGGRISTGSGDVVVGNQRGGSRARVMRRETRGANDGVRVIAANEGYPVLIQTGQSITNASTDIYGQVVRQTEYHDVTSGFYATVRLNGDLATITLSANHDHINQAGSNVIEVQRTDTVVTAQLGEWVTIGGMDDGAEQQDNSIGRRITTRNQAQQSVRLRVERVD